MVPAACLPPGIQVFSLLSIHMHWVDPQMLQPAHIPNVLNFRGDPTASRPPWQRSAAVFANSKAPRRARTWRWSDRPILRSRDSEPSRALGAPSTLLALGERASLADMGSKMREQRWTDNVGSMVPSWAVFESDSILAYIHLTSLKGYFCYTRSEIGIGRRRWVGNEEDRLWYPVRLRARLPRCGFERPLDGRFWGSAFAR
ncbi:hypothetical protein FB451DRAFT_651607 [Mycena latifolia]|nr:hypothetical protein FB451DRAFT_651607 [Mycena latifolia]